MVLVLLAGQVSCSKGGVKADGDALQDAVDIGGEEVETVAPVFLDCVRDNPDCPEIMIDGDPPAEIPGYGPSPMRGYADPSIRLDPVTDRLWMAYSFVDLHVVPPDIPGGAPVIDTAVSVHLAFSEDRGNSWTFYGDIRPSMAETDAGPGGGQGYGIREVSTMTPFASGEGEDEVHAWYGMHLRYHEPAGGGQNRLADSFHFRLTRVDGPDGLGDGAEQALGWPLTATGWDVDLDLNTLDPDIG
ncbi:MAG: hypothetical protein ABIJ56_22310, partial [Pseudomonadota bacterium]